jgi:hypothetical protein
LLLLHWLLKLKASLLRDLGRLHLSKGNWLLLLELLTLLNDRKLLLRRATPSPRPLWIDPLINRERTRKLTRETPIWWKTITIAHLLIQVLLLQLVLRQPHPRLIAIRPKIPPTSASALIRHPTTEHQEEIPASERTNRMSGEV